MAANKPAPIPMIPVKSSNVAAAGYDAPTQRFGVQFKSGSTYHYHGVTSKVASDILESDSIGSAVHQHLVKGGMKFDKLEAE